MHPCQLLTVQHATKQYFNEIRTPLQQNDFSLHMYFPCEAANFWAKQNSLANKMEPWPETNRAVLFFTNGKKDNFRMHSLGIEEPCPSKDNGGKKRQKMRTAVLAKRHLTYSIPKTNFHLVCEKETDAESFFFWQLLSWWKYYTYMNLLTHSTANDHFGLVFTKHKSEVNTPQVNATCNENCALCYSIFIDQVLTISHLALNFHTDDKLPKLQTKTMCFKNAKFVRVFVCVHWCLCGLDKFYCGFTKKQNR